MHGETVKKKNSPYDVASVANMQLQNGPWTKYRHQLTGLSWPAVEPQRSLGSCKVRECNWQHSAATRFISLVKFVLRLAHRARQDISEEYLSSPNSLGLRKKRWARSGPFEGEWPSSIRQLSHFNLLCSEVPCINF